MFTGIIETLGLIKSIEKDQENIHFTVESSLANELKIDQSLAHDGVCLTVVKINGAENTHVVTAIRETLEKTNLKSWKPGRKVNLERCMVMNGRLDGHIVQGHVDQTATCVAKQDQDGSWVFRFQHEPKGNVTVEKGSICVNGTSLTVVDSSEDSFSVAIIPYTYEHTVFHQIEVGDEVNLEFDIIGKYVEKLMRQRL
ncbi:MAG: riboflavin synthase [Bacteroidota bacterium]|nr:riboflavin synthase [Bacteroidota bacterium]MDX5430244.1 riboflavin synthase [Bacteroidota bacterium]MDX5469005.1 riboflavin synthase [Bacteroidota bacterium]